MFYLLTYLTTVTKTPFLVILRYRSGRQQRSHPQTSLLQLLRRLFRQTSIFADEAGTQIDACQHPTVVVVVIIIGRQQRR